MNDIQQPSSMTADYGPGYFIGTESDPTLPGPQQTRKTPSASSANGKTPQTPSYNPATLLNPKVAKAETAEDAPPVNESEPQQDDDVGAGSMIERLNGVTDRAEAPIKKRKVEDLPVKNSDEPHKKQKSDFGQSSGMLTDQLKQADRQAASNTIDLTLDDDDIQVTKDTGNEEVCLGVVNAKANVFRIPTYSQSAFRQLGKEVWPRAKVAHRKENQSNLMVDLLDSAGLKFGNLEPKIASAVSQLLAGGNVNRARFSVYILARPRKPNDQQGMPVSISWPVEILVYSPRRLANTFGRFLSQKQIFLSTPLLNPGKETVNPHDGPPLHVAPPKQSFASRYQVGHVSRTVEEIRRETNNIFDTLAKQADEVPERELSDDHIITTPLMSHQKQALHFLMEHEGQDGEVESPLWKERLNKKGQKAWYHVITGQEQTERPKPVNGGILADVMGLGKTLSILSLIAETREDAKNFRRQQDDVDAEYNARGTLIICPKSVMANWQEQVGMHTANNLSVYAYHGPNRENDAYALSKHDIVITTYSTVAAEFNDRARRQRALASINWYRIVLDEAHAIRTQSTQVFKACRALNAQYRWAVTGTPVQNGLDDLGALIKFLRIEPFENPMAWAQYIISPLKNSNEDAVQHLQILVGSISLRRFKDRVDLPDRHEATQYLRFSNVEWILYKQFGSRLNLQLKTMTQGTNALKGRAYAHILKGLSIMRQICAHGREMLSEEDMKEIDGADENSAIVIDIGDEPTFDSGEEFLTEKQAYECFSMMQDSEVAVCQKCDKKLAQNVERHITIDSDDDEDDTGEESSDESSVEMLRDGNFGYLTPCYHLICDDCKSDYKKEVNEEISDDSYYTCNFCGQYMRDGLFGLSRDGYDRFMTAREIAARRPRGAKWDVSSYTGPHTKVKQLIADLKDSERETQSLPEDEPPIRSVVFSGWTSYLDLIEYALGREGFGFLRLDGSMSVKARREVLEQFKTNESKTVLLVSITAGGQGLNFTTANKVYVMEPQYNPGVEQQAVDRVHRVGQKRDVMIKHYIMQGPADESTIENGIQDLQRKKESLAMMATGGKDGKQKNAAGMWSLDGIRKLLK